MTFERGGVDIFVPDGVPRGKAMSRTTHLAIGAHPDDIEMLAYHGIEECFGERDKWFTGVTITTGAGAPRAGMYAKLDDVELARLRKAEQRKAAEAGRYACQIQLGYASRDVVGGINGALVGDLAEILRSTRPETVYLHSPFDRHQTHISVLVHSVEAIRSLPKKAKPANVYGCEGWGGLDWLPEKYLVHLPSGKRAGLGVKLLKVYKSQIEGKDYVQAAEGRRRMNATFRSPREVDGRGGVTLAVDLAPLFSIKGLPLSEYIADIIDAFDVEAKGRLERHR